MYLDVYSVIGALSSNRLNVSEIHKYWIMKVLYY